jgi:DMATS type aromatic prenyltransferase
MLQEANYPEEVQRDLLAFYRDHIVPLLGNKPDKSSAKSGIGRDGNPFEYSFELKSSSNSQGVRFVVDLTELRPVDKTNPLSIATSQNLVDVLARKTPGFDDSTVPRPRKAICLLLPLPERAARLDRQGRATVVGRLGQSRGRGAASHGQSLLPTLLGGCGRGITSW